MKKAPIFGLLFLIYVLILIGGCSTPERKEINIDVVTDSLKFNKYGFIDDSLDVERVLIEKNKSLADILLPVGLSYNQILKMTRVDDSVFNARKVVSGKYFTVYSNRNDSAKTICCIVYEKNPLDYVIFDFGKSLKVIEGRKELKRIERTLSGVINYSLFQTIAEAKTSPVLALKLSDVFAWQIDFYRIQKGDSFKVIFEEIWVDNKLIDIGRIKAAVFNYHGKDFYAFYFKQDNDLDYFDEHGNSLRKAFLRAPLKFSRISSRFSNRRYHPVLHKYRSHHGIDFAAPTGTPVHAIGDGVVIFAKYKGGAGNYVKIRHNSTYQSGYMHLSKYAKGIRAGVSVKQGQTIGYVGSTGLATGPHLDLRFWKNGQLVNYLKIEFPPSKPIDEKYREEYAALKDSLMMRLNKINNGNFVAAKEN
ncbi:MAG: peptidoglycan DD-metalloendopeptidase family protein [Chlorobi bacterium]|nr:peptidoglycan DD-metalloendopeptidase family protein [Chlorobiota bacterium]